MAADAVADAAPAPSAVPTVSATDRPIVMDYLRVVQVICPACTECFVAEQTRLGRALTPEETHACIVANAKDEPTSLFLSFVMDRNQSGLVPPAASQNADGAAATTAP